MGIFQVAAATVAGELGDQWLERVEPNQLDNYTVASYGVVSRRGEKRNKNRKGSPNVISNGSLIQVPENAFMILVDSGKIIAATDQAGFYQVDNTKAPSIFFQSDEGTDIDGHHNTDRGEIERPGGIMNTLKDSFERFKFGGAAPYEQKVIYINKMEIPSIRFGTPNPIIFGDRMLVPGTMLSCEIRAHGTYSIKISDPMLFYREVLNKTGEKDFTKDDMAEQYVDEFLAAFSDALASLAYENISVIELPTRQRDMGKYMATTLDEDWMRMRGFYINSVAVRNMTYDEQTKEFINQHRQDALLMDPNRRAARMTRGVAAGIEAAGSNANGSMMGFAGVGMGMNAVGGQNGLSNVMNPVQANSDFAQSQNAQAPQGDVKTGGWTCSNCNTHNLDSAKFCGQCGRKKPVDNTWTCGCGQENTGNFCSECGSRRPETQERKCSSCGYIPQDQTQTPKFCPNCGNQFA